MQYSDLLETLELDIGAASIKVSDDWLQGRSVFGGLQVALAVRAMCTLVPPWFLLRTVQTNLHRPGAQRTCASAR